MISFLKETYLRLIDDLTITTHRYLYPSFNLNSRLTGLIGPRGVGKTTLMLQYIKENLSHENKVIYFSADLIYFKQTTLLECMTELYRNEGYRYFFIDEIHKYQNWNQELKNIYDAFPDIIVVFSGSSMLDLVKGSYDLSRRARLFHLKGMSFREYLYIAAQYEIEPVTYQTLLHSSDSLTQQILRVEKIQSHFQDYLAQGYYPFVFEDKHIYYERVARVIEKTIFEDIANFYNLKTPHLHLFKRILSYLASVNPGELNTHNLAQLLGIANQTVFHYLSILNDIGLIRLIYPIEGGNMQLRKPQKLLLHNTSLLYTLQQYLGTDVNKGAVRETFFVQALQDAGMEVFYSKKGDYQTRDAIFEVGGKNKTRAQLKQIELPGYLVKDDTFVSLKNVIPLAFLGFLY